MPFIFNDNIVCKKCHAILTENDTAAVEASIDASMQESRASASLAATAPTRSTWTPDSPATTALGNRRSRASRGGRIGFLIFMGLCALVGIAGLIAAPYSPILPLFVVLLVFAIASVMAWAPIAITQDEGRNDKGAAIAVLSILGVLSGGILWLIALEWSLAIEKGRVIDPLCACSQSLVSKSECVDAGHLIAVRRWQ